MVGRGAYLEERFPNTISNLAIKRAEQRRQQCATTDDLEYDTKGPIQLPRRFVHKWVNILVSLAFLKSYLARRDQCSHPPISSANLSCSGPVLPTSVRLRPAPPSSLALCPHLPSLHDTIIPYRSSGN